MKLRVVHTFGRSAGTIVELDKDVVRFGRGPDADVAFDPQYDRDASSRHAEARLEGGRWVLIDLGSRNGTFVGGERVTRHLLTSGEEIGFGRKGPRVRLELGPPAAAAPRAEHARATNAAEPPAAAAHPVRAPAAAAAPAGALAAPAAGARVGQRTIAMMISSAVAAATGRSKPRKTAEIAAMVDQQVALATAGQRRTSLALAALLVLSLGGLGALALWSSHSDNEISTLREELASLPPGDPRRKEIEGRLGTLHPSNANFGRNLYDRSKKGIYMLAAGGEGFCTAFAVRPNQLATNAHCIVAARRKGGAVVALENESGGEVRHAVSDMRTHPGYRDADMTPDVGVVTIAGRSAVVLELATAQELAAAGAGDDLYLIGFPGRLMDTTNPAATFMAAHLGRITSAAGRPGAFAESWLFQHDAPATSGTSGSPIFDGRGKVVAINAGGYLETDDQTIAGKKTGVVKESPYKFGMRIDLIAALLR